MKTIMSILVLFTFTVNAQNNTKILLNNYLEIKDALVKSDAKKATLGSTQFIKTLAKIDKLDKAELAVLTDAATKISKTSNIEKQRVAFEAMAEPMWKLVKASDSVTDKVYYDYCPMKNAYWLSLEEGIKNPYYGASMLTCGKVSDKK